MLVNFLLMCVSVLTLPSRNPDIARQISVVSSRRGQILLAIFGTAMLGGFLLVHIWKDIVSPVSAWYFRSTPFWLGVMLLATVVYLRELRNLRCSGVDVDRIFSELPPE
jgi:hypothetical protein